jgi:hypothetical protein
MHVLLHGGTSASALHLAASRSWLLAGGSQHALSERKENSIAKQSTMRARMVMDNTSATSRRYCHV